MCVTPRNGKIERLIVIFENWGSLQDVGYCQSRPEPKERAGSIERGSALRGAKPSRRAIRGSTKRKRSSRPIRTADTTNAATAVS